MHWTGTIQEDTPPDSCKIRSRHIPIPWKVSRDFMNKSVTWFNLQDMQYSDIAYYVTCLHPGNTRNIIIEIMVGECSHEVWFEDSSWEGYHTK